MALRRIKLLADRTQQEVDEIAATLEHGLSDVVEFLPEESNEVTLAIAIGGDGTLIKHGRDLAQQNIPLVGVNSGRLGFRRRSISSCTNCRSWRGHSRRIRETGHNDRQASTDLRTRRRR